MVNRKLVEKLHKAIEDTDFDQVHHLLKLQTLEDAKELCECEYGSEGTALHQAASFGDGNILRLISETGIDIDIKRYEGDIGNGGTALHEAVTCLHENAVYFLLSQGADVNIKDSDGITPLHVACRHNNVDVVDSILEAGASINIQDNKGMTPLQISIIRGSDNVAMYLLEKDVDVHVIDKDGQTPLHYATEWEAGEVIQSLIGKGANVNAQDNNGNTPLHLCPEEDIFDLLVKFGADLNIRNKRGKPVKEQRLDMEKEEYKDIDKALSRHTEKIGARKSHSAKVQENQQLPRIFSPGPPIPEAELKTARKNMLLELQKKTGYEGPAVTLNKTAPMKSPKSTGISKISPLAGQSMEIVTSQTSRTTIKSSK